MSRRLDSLAIRGQEGVSGSPCGPAVHLHSLSVAAEGVSGPVAVQGFIITRYPPQRRRTRTPSGPSANHRSLCRHEGVSGPRMVKSFIFIRYPPPGRRIRTPSGPAVHLHSIPAARKAYPVRERSRHSSSIAIRCQEGVSGPRVVQPFIFTRYPPPRRRFQTTSVPAVHLLSLSAARKAYPDGELFRRLSSLVIRHEEGVSGPRLVQRFILPPYP